MWKTHASEDVGNNLTKLSVYQSHVTASFPQTVGNVGGVLAYPFGSLVPNGAHSRGPSAVGLAKLKVAFREHARYNCRRVSFNVTPSPKRWPVFSSRKKFLVLLRLGLLYLVAQSGAQHERLR
jgi:hypothetical protein